MKFGISVPVAIEIKVVNSKMGNSGHLGVDPKESRIWGWEEALPE